MTCQACPLHKTATHQVKGVGRGTVPIMFIGEAPGDDEDKQGRPFVGQAGQAVYIPMLKRMGLARKDVWTYNVVGCRPPKNDISSESAKVALKTCPQQFLFPAIERLQPEVIVCMGATAIKVVMGIGKSLKTVRGLTQEQWFGNHKALVMATYHPASVLPGRAPGNRSVLFEDMRRAVYLVDHHKVIKNNYTILDTPGKVDDFFTGFLNAKIRRLVYDVEAQTEKAGTVNPRTDKILGISLCWKSGNSVYIPLRHRPPFSYDVKPFWGSYQDTVLHYVKRALESVIPKGGQNGKYDNKILENDLGIVPANYEFDTMLASHLIDENRLSHSLDEQVRIHFPEFRGWKSVAEHSDMASMTLPDIGGYCNKDADLTHRLWEYYADCRFKDSPEIEKLHQEYAMPLQRVIQAMEQRGAPVDVERIPVLMDEMEAKLQQLEIDMRLQFGRTVNPDSETDVIFALQDEGVDLSALHVITPSGEVETDDKGNPVLTTGRAHLEAIAADSPLAQLILDTRTISKLYSTYVSPIKRMAIDGYIYGSFLVHGTVTGRLSSRDPNLQNIPRGGSDINDLRQVWGKKVKGLYWAPPGFKLLQGDFSQMEVRTLAYYARDEELAMACEKQDVHLATACALFDLDFDISYRKWVAGDLELKELRQLAKSITFAVVYGASAVSVAKMYHLPVAKVEQFIKEYFARFTGADAWIKRTHSQIDRDKYVTSIFGRNRRIPYAGQRGKKSQAYRQAVNSIIQGTAADICGRAIIRLEDRFESEGLGARQILTVHDSIVVLVPDDEVNDAAVVMLDEMTKRPVDDFDVPLKVDLEVGQRWSELKKLKDVA